MVTFWTGAAGSLADVVTLWTGAVRSDGAGCGSEGGAGGDSPMASGGGGGGKG